MSSINSNFAEQGYFVHHFEHLDSLKRIKHICEQMCREEFSSTFTSLDKYHELALSPQQHDDFQYKVYREINNQACHRQFVHDNLPFFIDLFGQDIDIQTNLYIRIARPEQELDNIGMHRDTDYGNSAYEVSLSLPLVNQEPGCGLSVVPKSHLFSEHLIEQFNREDVEKGSNKNEMGFLYAPKKLLNLKQEQIKSIPLQLGSGLGFTLGLIHGQYKNTSQMTRWSIDFRLKNSFHPMTKNLKKGYYSPLITSAVTALARKYYQNNPHDKQHLVLANQSEQHD